MFSIIYILHNYCLSTMIISKMNLDILWIVFLFQCIYMLKKILIILLSAKCCKTAFLFQVPMVSQGGSQDPQLIQELFMTSCIYTSLALTHCLHCCTTCKNKNGNLEASKCVTRSGRGLTFSFWELHSTCICSYSGHNFNSFRPGLRSRSTECYSVIQVRVQEVQQNAQSRAELIIACKQLRLLK